MSDERDIYQRAYNICHDALLNIANYGKRSSEDYLRDNGWHPGELERMKEQSSSHWEYMRRMDYEVAESALERAMEVMRKLKDGDK